MKELPRNSKKILLDDEDVPRFLAFEQEWGHHWRVHKDGYVKFYFHKSIVQLARFILDYHGSLDVDHIDRNPLNNQKSNLRTVTRSINIHNSKRSQPGAIVYEGVRFLRARGKWRAFKGSVYIGTYPTQLEAVNKRRAFIQANENPTLDLCRTNPEDSVNQTTIEDSVPAS